MSIEDKRIPRRPEEEAAGVFQVDDTEEAQARALAEQPFRDVAKGRSDTDRDVLERVADEQGDKAGQEYRGWKELLPTEILGRLGKEFEGKLEGPKFDKNRHFAERLSQRFARFVEEIKATKRAEEEKSGKRLDIKSLIRSGFNISPIPIQLESLSSDSNNYYLSEEAENALYQTLGIGETRLDVVETFKKLTEEQKLEIAKLTRDSQVGRVFEEGGFDFSLPTRIEGIAVHLNKHHREKVPVISLRFTPEFLGREIK